MEPELNYPALLSALVMAESTNNPNAVSKDGAVGLTQILPQYAHDLRRGVPSVYDVADTYGHPYSEQSQAEAARLLTIPEVSLFLGDKLLQSLVQRENGILDDALRGYNMGADALDDWEASG
jgi:soluble lytic murein transglycosylase-like protein